MTRMNRNESTDFYKNFHKIFLWENVIFSIWMMLAECFMVKLLNLSKTFGIK